MRGCSRRQTAIKRNAVTLMAMLGLIGVAGCASPRSNLSDPAKFRTIQHALATDLATLREDLHHETSVAKAGATGPGEPPCYNLKNNVNFVVLKTIRTFVLGSVTADRNSLQSNINHIRNDRSNFEQDMFDFLNDGVNRPVGATKAITEITQKINHAKAKANSVIRKVNHVVRKAYDIANNLALLRGCVGDGPGTQMPRIALLT